MIYEFLKSDLVYIFNNCKHKEALPYIKTYCKLHQNNKHIKYSFIRNYWDFTYTHCVFKHILPCDVLTYLFVPKMVTHLIWTYIPFWSNISKECE